MVVHRLNIVQKVEIFVNMKPLRHKNHVSRSPINDLCSNPVSPSAKSECWQQRFGPCQQKQALMGVIDCHHYNSETAMGGYAVGGVNTIGNLIYRTGNSDSQCPDNMYFTSSE